MIGIEHSKNARALEKEVNKLKTEDAMNDKRISLAKLRFEKMKAYLLSYFFFTLFIFFPFVVMTFPFWHFLISMPF